MLQQFNAQRFRWWRGKRVGTVPIGTIIYIQDGVRPLTGLSQPVVTRNPWLVEAWLNRDYSLYRSGKWTTVKCAGGHLAQVHSLRDGRRQLVADWILLACMEAGLEREYPGRNIEPSGLIFLPPEGGHSLASFQFRYHRRPNGALRDRRAERRREDNLCEDVSPQICGLPELRQR